MMCRPADCQGKGASRRIALKDGVIEIVPAPGATISAPADRQSSPRAKRARPTRGESLQPKPCTTKATLKFTARARDDVLTLDPCAYSKTGAVIETSLSGACVRVGHSQTGRPWGQPLRER